MVTVLFLVIAIALFLLEAFHVAIPKLPEPAALGLAFLAAAQLWPLAAKLGGG